MFRVRGNNILDEGFGGGNVQNTEADAKTGKKNQFTKQGAQQLMGNIRAGMGEGLMSNAENGIKQTAVSKSAGTMAEAIGANTEQLQKLMQEQSSATQKSIQKLVDVIGKNANKTGIKSQEKAMFEMAKQIENIKLNAGDQADDIIKNLGLDKAMEQMRSQVSIAGRAKEGVKTFFGQGEGQDGLFGNKGIMKLFNSGDKIQEKAQAEARQEFAAQEQMTGIQDAMTSLGIVEEKKSKKEDKKESKEKAEQPQVEAQTESKEKQSGMELGAALDTTEESVPGLLKQILEQLKNAEIGASAGNAGILAGLAAIVAGVALLPPEFAKPFQVLGKTLSALTKGVGSIFKGIGKITAKVLGKEAAETAAKTAAKEGAEQLAETGAKVASREGTEAAVETAAKVAGRETAEAVGEAALRNAGSETVEGTVEAATESASRNIGAEVAETAGETAARNVPTERLAVSGASAVADAVPKDTIVKAIAKNAGKFGLKMIPLAGAAVGLGLAIGRLWRGDFAGAAAEAGGVFLPSAAGLPLDLGLMARDVYNEVYGTEDNPFPHDADMVNDPAYGEKYKQIYDGVKDYFSDQNEAVEAANEEQAQGLATAGSMEGGPTPGGMTTASMTPGPAGNGADMASMTPGPAPATPGQMEATPLPTSMAISNMNEAAGTGTGQTVINNITNNNVAGGGGGNSTPIVKAPDVIRNNTSTLSRFNDTRFMG